MLRHQLAAMHTLRYSITTHRVQSGTDYRVVRGLLGPIDVSTSMIYRHAGLSGRAAAKIRPI